MKKEQANMQKTTDEISVVKTQLASVRFSNTNACLGVTASDSLTISSPSMVKANKMMPDHRYTKAQEGLQ